MFLIPVILCERGAWVGILDLELFSSHEDRKRGRKHPICNVH